MLFTSLLLAVLAFTGPTDLVPAHWPSSDPHSLELLAQSPINCLLIPESAWSADFIEAAHTRKLTVLAWIQPGSSATARVKNALRFNVDGAVLEGDFKIQEVQSLRSQLETSSKIFVELGLRNRIPFEANAPAIIGTFQGVWAGLNPRAEGAAHAAPSGAPWIDTNGGFLRFVRSASDRVFWLGAQPPTQSILNASRYQQMISDAATVGARWVVSFDSDFFDRLIRREVKALNDLKRINQTLKFFEANRGLQQLPAYGQLTVVDDIQSGALISGSVLDMISVNHTPVRPIRNQGLVPKALAQSKMVVSVDPAALDPGQEQILKDFRRAGGTVLSTPPGWRMAAPKPGQFVTDSEEVNKLDKIWREVNALMGRRNLGVRLFNVSSMLSNLVGAPDGSRLVLYLVNYSDFPVDTIAAHFLGKFSKITLYLPDRAPRKLVPYDNEDGTGVDVDIVESAAILIAER